MPRIVLKDLETEKTHAVPDTEAMLGRDPACGIVIGGPKSKVVSGRHARIFFQDNAWWIEDTSRNGTVLDDERLQAGQRHALRVGQLIGFGESGPRFRVAALESRKIAEGIMEGPGLDAAPPATTAPRKAAAAAPRPALAPAPKREVDEDTAAMRRSEALRAGVRFAEATEPMSPSADWLVQVALRATRSNHQFDVTAMVVKIGRSPECSVQIPPEMGASVSRVHAEILIHDGGVMVRDVGSRNGTFLNEKRIDAPHSVAKGDLIMLGSGGPTFSIDDLHIVKGETASQSDSTPVEPKRAKGKQLAEPRTDPSPIDEPQDALKGEGTATSLAGSPVADAGRSAMVEDAPEYVPEKSARRAWMIIWAIVGITVVIATALFFRSA
jgi:pSer/pThr/pTyr-binding forkhead associated (FHA) protein